MASGWIVTDAKYTNTKTQIRNVWKFDCVARGWIIPDARGRHDPHCHFPAPLFHTFLGSRKHYWKPRKLFQSCLIRKALKDCWARFCSLSWSGPKRSSRVHPFVVSAYQDTHCAICIVPLLSLHWVTLCDKLDYVTPCDKHVTCDTPHVTPCHKLTCNSRGVPPVSHAQSSPAWDPPAKILCLNIMDIIEFLLPANC